MKLFDIQKRPEQQTFLKLMLKAEENYDGLFGEDMIHGSPDLLLMQKSPSIFRAKSTALSINSSSILYSVENLNTIFFPDPKIESHFSRPGCVDVKVSVSLVGRHLLPQHKASQRRVLALTKANKENHISRDDLTQAS